MITEDYVSLELAKLLKEKTDIFCPFGWDGESKKEEPRDFIDDEGRGGWYDNKDTWISCPTISLVLKWLRESHNIVIEICLDGYYTKENGDLCINSYSYKIWTFFKHLDEQGNENPMWDDRLINDGDFDSYKNACEEAIKYCLEKLI